MILTKHLKIKSNSGFTIIELLIATSVFCTLLVFFLYGLVDITNDYFGGITINETQNAARDMMTSITQALQSDGAYATLTPTTYSGVTVDGFYSVTVDGFCIGNQQFSYLPGYELGTSIVSSSVTDTYTTPAAFVEDTVANCASSTPQNLPAGYPTVQGNDLMGLNMRLSTYPATAVYPPTQSPQLIVSDCNSPLETNQCVYTVNLQITYGASSDINNPAGNNGVTCSNPSPEYCTIVVMNTSVLQRAP